MRWKRYSHIYLLIIIAITFWLFLPTLTLSHLDPKVKEFVQDENNQTYLYGFDPYRYHAEANFLLEGNAPKDLSSAHPVIITTFHKTLGNWLQLDLMRSMFFYSFLLILLTCTVVFFFLHRLGNPHHAFLGTLYFLALMANCQKIWVGLVDTDIYNVLLPIIIVWSLYAGYSKKGWFSIVCSGFCIGLYSTLWDGWWLIFHLSWLSLSILLLYFVVTKEALYKDTAKTLIAFITSSGFFVIIMSSKQVFINAFTTPLPNNYEALVGGWNIISFLLTSFILITIFYFTFRFLWKRLSILQKRKDILFLLFILLFFILSFLFTQFLFHKKAAIDEQSGLFRPFQITDKLNLVIELEPIGVIQLGDTLGGVHILLASLLGYIVFFVRTKKRHRYLLAILATLWLAFSFSATLSARRFVVILLFPIAIGLFWLIDSAGVTLRNIFNKKHIKLSNPIIFIIFVIILIPSMTQSRLLLFSYVPFVNDHWIEMSDYIKNNTSQDALFIASWDNGYSIQALTQRKPLLTGGSQNSPAIYWFARALLSNDEKTAVGILRMLNCADGPYLRQTREIIGESPNAMKILEKIIKYEREEAQEILYKALPAEKAEMLLNRTHCSQTRENYLFLTRRLLESDSLPLLGFWDPEKNIPTTRADYSKINLCQNQSETTLYCGRSTYKLDEHGNLYEATILQNHSAHQPFYVLRERINNITKKRSLNPGINLTSYLFYDEVDGQRVTLSLLSTVELTDTMLTQLYLFDGKGLVHFEKAYETEFRFGQKEILYKITY